MNKNNLIILSLVILAMIFGIYYFTNNGQSKNPNSNVYNNSKYGFSIEYPNAWQVKENTGENTVAEFMIGAQTQFAIFTVKPTRIITDAEDLKKYINSLDPNRKYYQGAVQKIGNTDAVIVNEPKLDTGYHMMIPINQNLYLEIAGQFNPVYQEIFKSFRFK